MKTVTRVASAMLLLLCVCGGVFYFNPLWVIDQQIRFSLWRQGVRSEYIEAGGYRLHYFEARPAGDDRETPLVLVHGLASRGEDWAPMIPELAASGFPVYVLDLLGHGRSAHPDIDYSISLQAEAVEHFMHAKGIQRANVGGWSMGGWVAAKLAVDHPELVDRLVLYDSAGVDFPRKWDVSLFTPKDDAGFDRLIGMLMAKPPKLPEFVVRAAVRRIQRDAWVTERLFAKENGGGSNLDARMPGMRTPTLIVWGSNDNLIPASAGEKMHRLIPGSSMTVIEGCGHVPTGGCWPPTLAATMQFLKSEPPMKDMEQRLAGH